MAQIDLIVTLQAAKGREEALHQVLSALRAASLHEPGCLEYRVARAPQKAGRFFLLERWADAAALARHEHASHFLDGVRRVQACCKSVEQQAVEWMLE
ncbi:putative quinol monooxygenase [Pseudoxanthomonas winnipegensis]|jgi:quinol monooxygenase YgiN|uniref:Antibiotic biosynthesis monooxygenase n=1 Tax=Pseudoxanthomonas winnipegensis TaxID=2480810 RepID=A0A4Q8L797_9GAMM|nr:putative quinol monooxygenase [Pseudoxanthomonas winnipegensis]TAA23810.1 antibiotic biosynthesis monooxygenase [Pseudoxanthomonas winnipegensis]